MNCEPGDLAVIINDPNCNQQDIGRLVEVVCADPDCPTDWECRAIGGGSLAFAVDGYNPSPDCVSIPDAWLRPIRDPGEDATDEMVALLGKPASQPSKETA